MERRFTLKCVRDIITTCRLLQKMSAYTRDFDEIKYMYFLIKGDELLQKHIETWGKSRNSFKKRIFRERVYNKKYLKTKTNLW